MKRSLSIVTGMALTGIMLWSCGGGTQQGARSGADTVSVNLFEAHTEKAVFYDRFPGTVVALMQVDVRPEVEGYITAIYFTEGEHVTKGKKLYTIDDSKYQATVDQAKSAVLVAESNLDQAQKDADRYIYLNKQEAIAKQLLDHALTTLQNAKNQLTAARQELKRAQTDLNYSVVKAPFDGVIGLSQVKVGNTVVARQTVLNTVSTENPMAVDFVVNEKQIPRFVRLQQNGRSASDSIFTVLLPDNSNFGHWGKISVIDRGVNPTTGTITIRLVFPNPQSVLKPGMSCTVRVRNDDTTEQLLIPTKAVVEQMGEFFVYVAKDTIIKSSDTTVKSKTPDQPSLHAIQRKIQTGQTIGDRLIVRAGIQNGDRVITDGVQKLHDGSLIKTGKQQGK